MLAKLSPRAKLKTKADGTAVKSINHVIKIKAKVIKLMDTSPDTLDGVADKVFAAAERGEFMIIPTKREPMRWRMKRFLPGLYFRMILKLARPHIRSADMH